MFYQQMMYQIQILIEAWTFLAEGIAIVFAMFIWTVMNMDELREKQKEEESFQKSEKRKLRLL